MKRLILFVILMCVTEIIHSNDITPLRNVEVQGNDITVTYQFKGAIYQQDPLYIGSKFFKIPGFGINDCAGEPAVPFRSDCISLPQGASYEVSVIETQYTDTSFVLSPSRPPLFESDTIGYTLDNVPTISPYEGFFPRDVVSEGSMSSYQDMNLLRLCIYPLQYNCKTKIARIYSLIKYKIHYTAKTRFQFTQDEKSRKTRLFLERNTINNDKNIQTNRETQLVRNNNCERDNQYYLIITTDKYLSSIQDFVEWKRMKGKRVVVESRPKWYTASQVKGAISNLHDAVGDSLNYLLLVGNRKDIPASSFRNLVFSHYTDLYYACMGDSSDYIPEFHHGRILVNTPSEASHVFEKIIQYEREPIDSTHFYQKGLHVAQFQTDSVYTPDSLNIKMEQRRFALTSEEILNYIQSLGKDVDRVYYADSIAKPTFWNNDKFATGGQIPDSLKKPYFAWDGDSVDINTYINNGRFYVLKRGHGNITYWYGPNYHNSDTNHLQNENKYPVVFSICCNSGNFSKQETCFAETFLKEEKAGCVGILAATEKSLSGYNDILAETMFDAIWPDTVLRIRLLRDFDQRPILTNPVYELGEILDDGLAYMEDVGMKNTYGVNNNKKYTQYTRELFHCFGDPSMMMYTEKPIKFNLPSFNYRNGKICVQSPCDSTRITFYTPSSTMPIVESFIGSYAEYETNADSVIICLDKHNYVPYVQTFYKNIFIQNENINEERNYVGDRILVGHHVSTQKPVGNVIVENAKVSIRGNKVELHPGTTITHSKVTINGG